MSELSDVIDDLGKSFAEFKGSHNAIIRKTVDDALRDERYCREELERKVNELRLAPNRPRLGSSTAGTVEAKSDNEVLRNLIASPERKAMQVGSEADGGYLVLPYFSQELTTILLEQSPLRSLARIQPITKSDAFEEIIDIDETGASWVGETGSRNDTDTPQVGKLRIPVHEIYAQPKATQKILDDSVFDVAGWLATKVGDKFGRSQAAAFVSGDGVGKPRGFATYATAATTDATRAWGTFQHVATGASGGFASSNPTDALIDLVYSLKAPYRKNACWLMSRSTAGLVRKFKEATTNAYIWQPSLQAGQPDMLLGFPVEYCEDLPAIAANSLSVWFGDWKRGYTIVDRVGVRVLPDPYTDKPYVKFYTTQRVGGDAVDFHALKALKFA